MSRYRISRKTYNRHKQETEEKANTVIRHASTVQKSINDFPEIQKYIADRFPGIDLSHIAIHVSPASVVEDAGWDIGGCYIHQMNVIIVKDEIRPERFYDDYFSAKLNSYYANVETDDVVVHELLHAVSGKVNRSSRRFTHMEEEFVYTNCIDYYRNRGLNDMQIVEGNFLPFCIHDVIRSRKEFAQILNSLGLNLSQIRSKSKKEYAERMNQLADEIVPKIIEKAKENGYRMIKLYEEYGRGSSFLSDAVVEDISASRFASIDFEDSEF